MKPLVDKREEKEFKILRGMIKKWRGAVKRFFWIFSRKLLTL
jgi:hypothetical protein